MEVNIESGTTVQIKFYRVHGTLQKLAYTMNEHKKPAPMYPYCSICSHKAYILYYLRYTI